MASIPPFSPDSPPTTPPIPVDLSQPRVVPHGARELFGRGPVRALPMPGSPLRLPVPSSPTIPALSSPKAFRQTSGNTAPSTPSTPERPRPQRSQKPSPATAFKRVVSGLAPDTALLARSKREIRDVLDQVRSIPDSPNKKARADKFLEMIRFIVESVLHNLTAPSAPSSPVPADADGFDFEEAPSAAAAAAAGPVQGQISIEQSDERICAGLNKREWEKFLDAWTQHTLQDLSRRYQECAHRPLSFLHTAVINLGHIIDTETGDGSPKGFHLLCPENEHLRQQYRVQMLARNAMTGAWIGQYQPAGHAVKQSSFFPDRITCASDLLKALSLGNVSRQADNRCLMHIPYLRLHVELYVRDGVIVTSCFPIFYFAELDAHATHEIADRSWSSEDIRQFCIQAASAQGGKAVVYKTDQDCVCDIAPFIPGLRFKSGVYIAIRKTALLPS